MPGGKINMRENAWQDFSGRKMNLQDFPGGIMNWRNFFGGNMNLQDFESAGKLSNTIKILIFVSHSSHQSFDPKGAHVCTFL